MQKALFKFLLGKQASSSTVGLILLAFDVFHQLQNGFDFKLAFAGVAIFFVLRFMNEHGINVAPLLDEVLKLSAEQQAAKIANDGGLLLGRNYSREGAPLVLREPPYVEFRPSSIEHDSHAEQGLRTVETAMTEGLRKLKESKASNDAEKDALRNHPDPLSVDL